MSTIGSQSRRPSISNASGKPSPFRRMKTAGDIPNPVSLSDEVSDPQLEVKTEIANKEKSGSHSPLQYSNLNITEHIIHIRDGDKKYNPHIRGLFDKYFKNCDLFTDSSKINLAVENWLNCYNNKQLIQKYDGEILSYIFIIYQIATIHAKAIVLHVAEVSDPHCKVAIDNVFWNVLAIQSNKHGHYLSDESNLIELFFRWLLYEKPKTRNGNLIDSFLRDFANNPTKVLNDYREGEVSWSEDSKPCCSVKILIAIQNLFCKDCKRDVKKIEPTQPTNARRSGLTI